MEEWSEWMEVIRDSAVEHKEGCTDRHCDVPAKHEVVAVVEAQLHVGALDGVDGVDTAAAPMYLLGHTAWLGRVMMALSTA